MKFKLNLSKFHKVGGDKDHTVMRHEDGHEIKIAHNALSPSMKSDLQKMPAKMDEGGKIPGGSGSPHIDPNQVGGDVKTAKPEGFDYIKNLKEGLGISKPEASPSPNKMADGGEVTDQQAPQQSPVVINVGGGQQPVQQQPVDLGMNKAQELPSNLANVPPQQNEPSNGPNLDPNSQKQAPMMANRAPAAAADPYGMDAYLNSYQQGLGEQKQGIKGEAEALSQQGQAQTQALGEQINNQRLQSQKYQDNFSDLDRERKAFMQDIQNAHVDPEKYWDNHSKLATGIGILLAGFNPTSNPNAAMNFLHQQMQMNLEAQKAELGKKENLLSANMRQFGNLRDASDMTRVMQADMVANQLRQSASQAMDPLAKARALQAAGQLDQQAAPILSQIAMRRTIMGNLGNSGDPAQIGNMITNMRMVNPEMAKSLEQRYVPGVGLAQIPIPDKVREEMTARSDLSRQLHSLEQWAGKHSGSLSPTDRNTGAALARNVQDAYRRANGQGVFREAEKDFVEKSISADPAQFLNKIRALPGYKATEQTNRSTLQNLYKSYGINVPSIQEAPPVVK